MKTPPPHEPATPREARIALRRLAREIARWNGPAPVRLALGLMLHTLAPVDDVCAARWVDFNLRTMVWTAPARKGRATERVVRLSPATLRLLLEIRKYAGRFEWLFSDPRDLQRPLRAATLRRGLRSACPGLPGGVNRIRSIVGIAYPACVATAGQRASRAGFVPDAAEWPDKVETWQRTRRGAH